MKNFSTLFLLFVGIILVLSFGECNKSNSESDIPVFSYLTPVIDPPATFQLVFNISTYGNKEASIKFDTRAGWLVEKLGDGRINFWVTNDSTTRNIFIADTLGFKGGYTYTFTANNNNYEEFNNFFTQFNKLAIEYDTFEPKF